MIIDYGFSLTGKSHITRGICCQDNHKIKKLDNGWYIAAIADGVGSAKNSQIGSKIATETVVSMCEEYMPWDYNVISIKSMMRTAYNYAYKQILRESQKSGEPIETYDTTLTMVIYDGHRIIYGHSGDGAIIGLNSFGNYVLITKPQKGVDGVTVLPLRAGYTQWKIDSYEEELASVLLVTDGMLEIFCPYLLKDITNRLDGVYIPLASFFADPIGFDNDEKNTMKTVNCIKTFLTGDEKFDDFEFYSRVERVYEKHVNKSANVIIGDLKKNNYPIILMQNVQDDKTIVGLINTEIEVDSKESTFYEEPDWQKLQENWNRRAYPHLYKERAGDIKEAITEKSTTKEYISIKKEIGKTGKQETNDEFVPFGSSPEAGKARQAMEAYERERTVGAGVKKPISPPKVQSTKNVNTVIKKGTIMEKHDRPKKKGIIEKMGDVFG